MNLNPLIKSLDYRSDVRWSKVWDSVGRNVWDKVRDSVRVTVGEGLWIIRRQIDNLMK